jgi:TP901 family phage tail tape measure protein
MIAKLFVEIGADIKDLSKGIGDAEHTLQRFSKNVGALGKTLTTRLTLPLAGIGAGVVKLASDFESSFADIRKTVDATDAEFADIEKGIRSLAKEVPTSVNELNKLAGVAGQLGVKSKDIVEFTKVMAMLGDTTNVSGEEASLAIARFMNIMGTSQSDVSNLGSAIVALGNNFATTESEIIMIGTSLASFGSALKLSESDVLAFATAIASSGGNVEASATAFQKTAFTIRDAVLTGNEDLAVFAETASMTVEAFSQSFRDDAGGAIVQFLAGLKRIQEDGQSTTMVLDQLGLADQRLQREFGKVISNLDQLDQAFDVADQAFTENTALTDEAQKRYETFASQVGILVGNLKDIGITFGQDILPVLKEGIDSVKGVADAFSNMSEETRSAITKIVLALGVTAPLMVLLSTLIGSFLTIKKVAVPAFALIGKAIGRMNPYVAGAIVLFQSLRTAFAFLPDSAKDAINKSVNRFKLGFQNIKKNFEEFVKFGFKPITLETRIKMEADVMTTRARQSVGAVEPEVVILEENIVIPEMDLDFTAITPKTPIVVPVQPEFEMADNIQELMDLELDKVDFGTVAGSIGGLNQNIREFSNLQERATDPSMIQAYQKQIEKLQAQIRQLSREATTFGSVMMDFGENAVKGFVDATLNGFFNALMGVKNFNTQELELRKMSLEQQQLALEQSLKNQEIEREEYNLRMALLNQELLDTETQIAQARENVFKKSLRNMGDAVKGFVKEALAELAKLMIISAIGKMLGLGTVSTTGDLAKGIFDKIGKSRTGGMIQGNVPRIVGEQGMEIFVPNTSGTVVSNGMINSLMKGGGGSSQQNIRLGGEFRISGNDLVLALSEANYTLDR